MTCDPEAVFLKACRGEPVPFTPVWLMRQAGRYQKDYRELRARVPFLELCRSPELAAEVTVSAATKLGTDAAIIFSDILMVLEPLGMKVEFVKGEGPQIDAPIREPRDLARLKDADASALGFVHEAVRRAREALPASVPLIGFAGAPFTVASYLIEGGPSRDYAWTKRFLWSWPDAWRELLARIARITRDHLVRQVAAGADVIQLFDTWVGCLCEEDYRTHVLDATSATLRDLGAPTIHFGLAQADLLPAIRAAGGDVIGVDARTDIGLARRVLGWETPVQGNLDPAALLLEPEKMKEHVKRILERAGDRGHVFNLGHGILQETPEGNARALVDMVHELSAR
jgi:uroporphyrinogen decarboxylase